MREARHLRAALDPTAKPPVESVPQNNLPTQLTTLIGREREETLAREILLRQDVRLLTLTGPGGVGKTRLALRVAERLKEHFSEGLYVVRLAPITDSDLVIPTIAQTIGLMEVGERPLIERLKAHLRDRRLLLFLDNFEQVAKAGPLVVDLLEACPRLKALVTSRATLHLSGEHVFPVPPLELPDAERLPNDFHALSRYEAIELFVARVRAIKPDFGLTQENASTVARICARMDGLPLAIELAAARVELLSPRALLARLEYRLQLLTGGASDLPARQRTLRNTLAWSYDLLGEGERQLFRRLSVFVGGCTLHAAETVDDRASSPPMGTLNRLASLVDKNLLRQIEQDDVEPRFVMLETIREYAIEQLTASEEEEAIRHAHADYYVALAEEVEPKLTTAEQGAWLERLETEHDNLRSAFSWALKRGETEVALRLGGSLWRFWYMWGYMSEGRRWLEEALVLSGAGATLLRAKALGGAGHLAWGQGDLDRAAVLHEESLELYRQSGDKAGIATALNGLSFVSRMRRDYTKARAMCEEALAIHRELDDRWGIAQSLFLLGAVAAYQGDHVAARPPLEESVALFQETGDREGLADALGVLGMTALSRGDLAAARSLAGESRTIFESIGDRRGVAKTLTVMGDIFLEEGELEAARARHEEGLEILWDLDDRWGMAWCLEGLAGVTASQGQPVRAARIFGAAEALREAIEGPRPPVRQAIYERKVAAARAGLDDKAFAAAWAEGRAMAPEQALATEEQTSASGLPDEPPELTRLASTPTYPAGLTSREVEVLRLVAQGLTNAQVGEGLFISPRTVDTHLTSIYQKLGVSSRSAATRYAVDHNLT